MRGETAGRRVAVGMSADVALVGLAAVMKRFQSLQSDFELRVIVTAPNRLNALLKAGKLDWAIGYPSLMTGIPTEKWSVQLEWATCNNLDFDESCPIPLVLLEGPCSWQDEMLDSLSRAGRDWRVTFESASLRRNPRRCAIGPWHRRLAGRGNSGLRTYPLSRDQATPLAEGRVRNVSSGY